VAAVNAFRASRSLAAVSDVACPRFVNLDIRAAKTLAFQGHRVEFVAQLFNVFNHANFAVPINNLTSSAFGQVTQLQPYINAPSRQVELAVRYQF
jgi:hypothetical protein